MLRKKITNESSNSFFLPYKKKMYIFLLDKLKYNRKNTLQDLLFQVPEKNWERRFDQVG
jgi:hypothetical protein